MFTATQFHTVADKEKFVKHFLRFIKSGYNYNLFHKWFYKQLSFMFGHIAHYNKAGFYDVWFSSPERQAHFLENVRTWGCYGDPAYTYSDVEKHLQRMI